MSCDGESCKFNCNEQEKEKCCDPLDKTIRKPENISTLLQEKNRNPFDLWNNLSSPTEKSVTRQDSTTDSLTYSEDSDVDAEVTVTV